MDELVLEVPQQYAEEVQFILSDSMTSAGVEFVGDRIPIKADAAIGTSWADKS